MNLIFRKLRAKPPPSTDTAQYDRWEQSNTFILAYNADVKANWAIIVGITYFILEGLDYFFHWSFF